VLFWVIKSLSTGLGESTSDFLVHTAGPVTAVLIGFVAFVTALITQLIRRRYVAWSYWAAVVMVGIFGTMAADVLHVGFGIPYVATTILYAASLAAVFILWQRVEGTLSIHSIDTTRRELFYWAAVMATFALGTSAGDVAAITLDLGYARSILLFAGLILIPILGFLVGRWNPVFTFWFAYVLTRPLGASVADWLGKPVSSGGRDWGSGPVSVVLALCIVALVAYLSVTKVDVQLQLGDDRPPIAPVCRTDHSTLIRPTDQPSR
jgi:uncharacterized membrane-anchored protein